ncbi:hypothetical protein [Caulobacter sp. BP25]|uniref:hypothetical protein n=1 Tax=Caulobacter sp. BP25 TaxID=2048900 RepID=UPI000C12DEC0|nr:hypothetical protein [Caulobacter sp. BP25]PHY18822.1 hypothetical protein CSW59_10250 [Caulobacter sp. BP25]
MTTSETGDAEARREHARVLRIRNWSTAVDIMAGRKPRPTVCFPAMTLEAMRRGIASSPSGLMIVSAHFSTYFLLLDLATPLGLPFLVLTSQEGVAFWRENRGLIPDAVQFVSALTPRDLRNCRQKRCILFCMADYAASGLANAYAPLLGRLRYLTIAWAKIATRLECDVFPVIAHHVDERLDVLVDHVPGGQHDAYALATRVIRRLDAFMKLDPDAWELASLLIESYPVPDDYGAEPARREMLHLAQSDIGIRSALRSALAHGEVV